MTKQQPVYTEYDLLQRAISVQQRKQQRQYSQGRERLILAMQRQLEGMF